MARDYFKNREVSLSSPATHAEVLTASTSTDLPFITRYIIPAHTGTHKFIMKDDGDTDIITINLIAGALYPLRIRRLIKFPASGAPLGLE